MTNVNELVSKSWNFAVMQELHNQTDLSDLLASSRLKGMYGQNWSRVLSKTACR